MGSSDAQLAVIAGLEARCSGRSQVCPHRAGDVSGVCARPRACRFPGVFVIVRVCESVARGCSWCPDSFLRCDCSTAPFSARLSALLRRRAVRLRASVAGFGARHTPAARIGVMSLAVSLGAAAFGTRGDGMCGVSFGRAAVNVHNCVVTGEFGAALVRGAAARIITLLVAPATVRWARPRAVALRHRARSCQPSEPLLPKLSPLHARARASMARWRACGPQQGMRRVAAAML